MLGLMVTVLLVGPPVIIATGGLLLFLAAMSPGALRVREAVADRLPEAAPFGSRRLPFVAESPFERGAS